ncbi:hypothetical protein L915_13019 [Phytophthora nicotianae]|uniref:Uncharacterized protein n=1 Tax=Phytophthora nicotianae TaxID=4792 RepID=W2GGY5_PHYNI|nr:hypothetical protein L915_13019 [Phytophthora nicotianae]
MHSSSEEAQADSQVTSFIRSVTRGVPRRYKTAYLLQRLQLAREEDLYVEAAMIHAELVCQPAPSKQLRVPFNFNALSDSVRKRRFRFDKSELCTLVQLMNIGDIVTREWTRAAGIEALCMVLYKLAVPVRWVDVREFFGRSSSGLSNVFLQLLDVLEVEYADLLLLAH